MPDLISNRSPPNKSSGESLPAGDPSGAAATSVGPGLPSATDRYDFLAEIAHGGMGVVYTARDKALSRDVAVKVLHERFPPGTAAARRFVEEAKITGQLQHP